jgi:epoxyqueuosine reductase
MYERLSARLSNSGFRIRVVPIRRLGDLRAAIDRLHRQRLFDPQFYRQWISHFDSTPPAALPQAASIVLIAVPLPYRRVAVTWEGRTRAFVIPPTYFEEETERKIGKLIEEIVGPAGYSVARADVPKKLLAVCSGLAEYGRNNISYIPEMGSFFGLVAFYSDLPAAPGQWRGAKMMERCKTCSACGSRCPTGAITAERFLLRAERCLTFHNESPAAEPFPAWIDPSWHNCLIGCLRCQTVCPVNRRHLERSAHTVRFSQRETERLLRRTPAGKTLPGRLPPGLTRRLRREGLAELLEVLPRNLAVLMDRPGGNRDA